MTLNGKSILLVISGGIAAYKSLELIRLIKQAGGNVRCILTEGGQKFITPLSVASLSGEPCYIELWSLKDEAEMGHIRLSREADLIVVAPASANLIAKMAHGLADDLASTTLLAANKPILLAPAMNVEMWVNPAVQDNIETLADYGIHQIGPSTGDLACGETGAGRMAEPQDILTTILALTRGTTSILPHLPSGERAGVRGTLQGYKALVTSGPTHEPLDPVRFIANRSSGKQGHAIAAALAAHGAEVTLVTGPVTLADPPGVKTIHIETAAEMLDACKVALPVDIAICAAAVADWSATTIQKNKIKKRGKLPPELRLKPNPDILATLARPYTGRPKLVIGFAAETENLLKEAATKRKSKNADWILANDIGENPFGGDDNHVFLITAQSEEDWNRLPKNEIAARLAERIAEHFTAAGEKSAKRIKSA